MKYRVINGFYDADEHRIIEKNEKIDLDNSKANMLMAKSLVRGIPEESLKDSAVAAEEENEAKAEKKTKK